MQVKEEDRPKTAFSTHQGQFQWRAMSFGLTNGPASFTQLMNLALSGLTWTHCLVYLDDIIIWSSTFEDHLHRLRLLFDRIRAAGLKLKPSKCHFLRKEVAGTTEYERASKLSWPCWLLQKVHLWILHYCGVAL